MGTRLLCRAEKITSYSQIIKESEMAVDDLVEEITKKLGEETRLSDWLNVDQSMIWEASIPPRSSSQLDQSKE